jgi:hypothetical protein
MPTSKEILIVKCLILNFYRRVYNIRTPKTNSRACPAKSKIKQIDYLWVVLYKLTISCVSVAETTASSEENIELTRAPEITHTRNNNLINTSVLVIVLMIS